MEQIRDNEAYDKYFLRDKIDTALRKYRREEGPWEAPFTRDWWSTVGAKYPPAQRPWTEYDEEDLIQMVEDGKTDEYIAGILRRTRQAVMRKVRNLRAKGMIPPVGNRYNDKRKGQR